jgi:hypothetical protein
MSSSCTAPGISAALTWAPTFGRMYQASYLTGLVAGMVTQKSIGYVAPIPIPEVIRITNAFVLGCGRSTRGQCPRRLDQRLVRSRH